MTSHEMPQHIIYYPILCCPMPDHIKNTIPYCNTVPCHSVPFRAIPCHSVPCLCLCLCLCLGLCLCLCRRTTSSRTCRAGARSRMTTRPSHTRLLPAARSHKRWAPATTHTRTVTRTRAHTHTQTHANTHTLSLKILQGMRAG